MSPMLRDLVRDSTHIARPAIPTGSTAAASLKLSTLSGLGKVITLDPGEILFEAGGRTRHMYYVATGLLRAEHISSVGAADRIGYFERGTTINTIAMLIQPFTVIAVDISQLIAFTPTDLCQAVSANPYAAAHTVAFASSPLSEFLGYLHVAQLLDVASRLAACILLEFDRRVSVLDDLKIVDLRAARWNGRRYSICRRKLSQ